MSSVVPLVTALFLRLPILLPPCVGVIVTSFLCPCSSSSCFCFVLVLVLVFVFVFVLVLVLVLVLSSDCFLLGAVS